LPEIENGTGGSAKGKESHQTLPRQPSNGDGSGRERAQSTMDQQHDGNLKDEEVHDCQTDLDLREIPGLGDSRTRRGDSDTKPHSAEDAPKGRNKKVRNSKKQLDKIRWREVRTRKLPAWKGFSATRKAYLPAERRSWLKEENSRNRECRCYDFDFRCWSNSEETWDEHTWNQDNEEVVCQDCYKWMMRYCPVKTHHWKNKRNLLGDISARKATIISEPFATMEGRLCCEENWCIHEFVKHREKEIPWWACYGQFCKEHQPMKQRNGFFPAIPRITIANAQTCPCLRVGCLCGTDKRHPFHEEMSSDQTCLSEDCRSHMKWKKGTKIHEGSSRTSEPELVQEVNELITKFAGWRIDQVTEDKAPTIRIDVEVKGQKEIAEVDCGATGNFVNLRWAKERNFQIRSEGVTTVTMFDGSEKDVPKRKATIEFKIGTKRHSQVFQVLEKTGRNRIVLGMPWLRRYNPEIDWTKRRLRIGRVEALEAITEEVEAEKGPAVQGKRPQNESEMIDDTDEVVEEQEYQERLADARERVPEQYHRYLEVFAKRK
jgi:hypothetical protein